MIIKSAAKIADSLIEFAFPHHCYVCNEKINDAKDYLCKKCLFSMPIAKDKESLYNDLIKNIGNDDLAISDVFCLLSSTDERYIALIHSLKYEGFSKIGYYLASMLAKIIIAEKNIDYDLIIPVPIHKVKKRERGYNQSEPIARAIAAALGCDCSISAVLRNKYTETQTVLDSHSRKINVRNAFQVVRPSDIKAKKILAVDDVLTTGSTINSLAEELLMHGAIRVDAATLLKA